MKAKNIIFVIIVTLALVYQSCGGSSGHEPPQNKNNSEIIFDGYLGYCNSTGEGSVKNLDAEVYVEAIDQNGNTTVIFSDFWTVENVTNIENTSRRITVPEKGSYSIILTITASECFSCCNGNQCGSNEGKPKYRATKLLTNQQNVPNFIRMDLQQIVCL